ncbi:hypothetical protein AB0D10_44465 [Kitasatospora sp. NPDC048545]|uniref:hypothetical protein n=1 Tax=Kitasatospora sp. NPDC048545 TaxID=3157208 RepID=UPI0033E723FA
MADHLPQFAAEPERVIVEAVLTADPQLPAADVEAVLVAAVRRRPDRRQLAEALDADPELLTSARAEGPRSIEHLIRALIDHGARHLRLPRCSRCQKERPLPARNGDQRICTPCKGRLIALANPCVICGGTNFAVRDRNDQPRCRRHLPEPDRDVFTELSEHVAALPIGLTFDTAAEAIREAVPSRHGQLRLLWALEDQPDLLTEHAVTGPPKTLLLVKALADRGAAGLSEPLCPFCKLRPARSLDRDGMRCCKNCWRKARAEPCSACGRSTWVAARTFDGAPLCTSCRGHDAFHHQTCIRCGTAGRPVQRTADGILCRRCSEKPIATCSVCGRSKPVHHAQTSTPICGSCSTRAQKPKTCSRCGTERRANYRTPDGRPLCKPCGQPRVPCHTCGNTRVVHGRTPDNEPLCEGCWSKHPVARRPCSECGTAEKLFHHGLCVACSAPRALHAALGGDTGTMRAEVEPVFHALLHVLPPLAVLRWTRPSTTSRRLLGQLAAGSGPVTHAELDRLGPPKAVKTVRSALVAGGALPARDERLADLESWLARTYTRVANPDDRKALRSFATWYHLRRLRRLPEGQPVTAGRAIAVRHEVRNVVRLLEWLEQQGAALGTATQDHVDAWLAEGPVQRVLVRNFLLWASRRGHANGLQAPWYRGDFTLAVIAQDHRWSQVQRLVGDDTLDVVDRAAGLLLLLLAQPPSRISILRTDQVTDHGDKVTLQLGRTPVDLPPPLDDLIRVLVQRRTGRAAATPLQESNWLFPGGLAGRPMSPEHLAHRLRGIGIHPRAARNTALMDLAAELPAVVVSRLLGFHQNTADTWQREATGSGTEYAADLTRR